jgi:hypothetical protein
MPYKRPLGCRQAFRIKNKIAKTQANRFFHIFLSCFLWNRIRSVVRPAHEPCRSALTRHPQRESHASYPRGHVSESRRCRNFHLGGGGSHGNCVQASRTSQMKTDSETLDVERFEALLRCTFYRLLCYRWKPSSLPSLTTQPRTLDASFGPGELFVMVKGPFGPFASICACIKINYPSFSCCHESNVCRSCVRVMGEPGPGKTPLVP